MCLFRNLRDTGDCNRCRWPYIWQQRTHRLQHPSRPAVLLCGPQDRWEHNFHTKPGVQNSSSCIRDLWLLREPTAHSQLSSLPPGKHEIQPVMTQQVVLRVSFSSALHLNAKTSTEKGCKDFQSFNRHLNRPVIPLNMECHVSFSPKGATRLSIHTL